MMINPSPEYAITKLGMSHSLSRKRDKPLRTYGKRSASAPDAHGEPPSKKPRLEVDEKAQKVSLSSMVARTVGLESQDAASEYAEHAELAQPSLAVEGPLHASILGYFKPLTLARKGESLNEVTIRKPVAEPSHPYLTPDIVHARGRPRLLRLRGASAPLSEAPKAASDEKYEAQTKQEAVKEKETHQGTGNCETEQGTTMRDTEGHQEEGNPDGSRPGTAIKVRRSRRVQTTLNISTRAAFAECKVCNTVWNPLYPDDVKYHAKHHATVTRSEKKKQHDL